MAIAATLSMPNRFIVCASGAWTRALGCEISGFVLPNASRQLQRLSIKCGQRAKRAIGRKPQCRCQLHADVMPVLSVRSKSITPIRRSAPEVRDSHDPEP